jgi:hypothetical protein
LTFVISAQHSYPAFSISKECRAMMRALVAVLTCWMLVVSPMRGTAQSAGNTCATAGVITTNGSYPFNTAGSGADDPCFFGGPPTVWYRFTAPSNGTVNADLCGSSFDTYLTAWAGPTCPAGCEGFVAIDNNSCGLASAVSFAVTAGTTYHFAVSGNQSVDFGAGVFNFQFIPAAGDTCATAGVLIDNGTYNFDTTGASPDDPCAIIPTVWYRFTAPFNGTINADLCGSSFNTYLTVWAGSSCPASCVDILADNDDSCGTASAVSFAATAGTTYHFAVSGAGASDFGPGVLNFSLSRPPGDTCDTAIDVSSGSSTPFDLTFMSAGDDPCDGPEYRTIWYKFTAPANGRVTGDTCGSSFNTAMAAFIAEGCPVTCGDIIVPNNNSCDLNAIASFDMRQSETAYFVVGGAGPSDAGPGVFNLVFEPVEAGLFCSTAGEVVLNGTYAFNTTGVPDGDPCFLSAPAVWYRYTAPTNGTVNVDLCGSSFDTWLTLFSAEACPVPCANLLVTNNNSCGLQSAVTLNMAAGQSILICVAGAASLNFGPGVMNFAFTPTPPLLGDINADGVINVADVTELGNLLSDGALVPLAVGDINGDAVVNDLDVEALAALIVND